MKRQSGKQNIIDQDQTRRGYYHRISEEKSPEWIEFDKTPDFGTRKERAESFADEISKALGLRR